MLRASIARRTTTAGTGTAAFELIAHASRPCILREMMVVLAAATASTYGLGRPGAIGVTPTSPVNLLPEEGIGPYEVLANTALAWATPPTVPANFFRRVAFPATIASFITWEFERGLYIPEGTSIVLWNLAVNGVVDVSVVIDE